MKRQIITAVSRMTVLVFVVISLCGCWDYQLEKDEAPMYLYVTCEKLGYNNEEALYTDYSRFWTSHNCITVEEQNVYVHIRRQDIDYFSTNLGYEIVLTIKSDTGYIKKHTEYPIVECEFFCGINNIDGTYNRYEFKQQEENSGKMIFTDIKEPFSKHNGKWSKLHLSGEFEVALTDVNDKTNTMTIRGVMRNNWIYNWNWVEDVYNDSL